MRHRLVIGAVVALAVIVGLALLFWPKRMAAPPPPPASGPVIEAPAEAEYPLPEAAADPAAEPLPALADSDAYMIEALGELIGSGPAHELVAVPGVVRRIVVTVDHLAREKLPVLTRAVGPVPGTFAVTRDGERIVLAEENFARYTPYVQLIAQLDVERLVAVYQRVYPLLQQAYGEVGPADRPFSDRVIAVIDELLATPEVAGPIELEQPSVWFRYKDPGLEALSSGQKLLLRMGTANAAIVKGELRALRSQLTHRP